MLYMAGMHQISGDIKHFTAKVTETPGNSAPESINKSSEDGDDSLSCD